MSQPHPMPDGEAVLAAALEQHQAGHTGEAEALYRQALDLNPVDPTGLYLLGLLSFETGRPDEAAQFLETVVDVRPDHAQARLTLAQLRHWRGEHAAAIAGYRHALMLAPERAEAAIGLANVLREAGQAAQAIAEGEAAAAAFPRLAEAWMALGSARLAGGDPASAANAYEAAIALDPDRLATRTCLANAFLAAGQFAAAEAAASDALAIDPASADAWFLRGAALRALFRTDEAITALEQAVALDPLRPATLLDLGGVYAERGLATAAEASLLAALTLEPSSSEAHASLGSVYLRGGREAPAEKHSRLALALDPTLVAPHQTLASLLERQGWAEEAKRHRDAAYAGRNLFVEPAAAAHAVTVLMPITAEAGNTPVRDLMPRARIGRMRWVVEYATDEQFAQLPAYDVVFNAIADVDLAGPTRAPMRRFLTRCRRPVLNPPEAIARTRRDRLPALLAGLPGVVVPPARRLSAAVIERHGLAAAIGRSGVKPPLLLRPAGAHGGRGLTRVEAIDELHAPPAGDLYATAYCDYRSGDGLYRKYRVIYVDRRPYPYHLAISPNWLVHYESAGMHLHAQRCAEEEAFLAAPCDAIGSAAMEAIAAIGLRIDLDYAGIDFAVLDGGRVLVFEANATMLAHAEEPHGPSAYKNPAVAVIIDAFATMIAAAAKTRSPV